jgi:hypothetical protein
MAETLHTPHTPDKDESAERKIQNRHPLMPEIIENFFKLFDGLGDTVKCIDVVTAGGDLRRITRHPVDKFLLKIACPNFTGDLNPSNPDIYRELFILDGTLEEVNKDSTDEGIERIKIKAKLYNALPYCVRAGGGY